MTHCQLKAKLTVKLNVSVIGNYNFCLLMHVVSKGCIIFNFIVTRQNCALKILTI